MAEESRDVAIAEGRALAAKIFQNLSVQNRVIEGMEGITPADLGIRPPMLRIIHKVDKPEEIERGLKPGYFQLGSEPCVPMLDDVVFLRAQMTRVLMEGEGASARPTCGSANCRTPYDFLEHPKSAECPPCEYSQWETHPTTGKRIPPPCQRAVVFLGIEGIRGDSPKPFWFVCKKTAFQPAATFLSELQQNRKVGTIREMRIRLATERKTGEGGGVSWYVPIFAVAAHDPAQRESFRMLFELSRDFNYTHGLSGGDTVAGDDEPRVIEPEVIPPGGNGGMPGSSIPF